MEVRLAGTAMAQNGGGGKRAAQRRKRLPLETCYGQETPPLAEEHMRGRLPS